MGLSNLFGDIYRNKTVLVTGHTGFKGSWLAMWLNDLGAKVIGLSLGPVSEPSHYDLAHFDIISVLGDIRDPKSIAEVIDTYNPQIIFHLAAQSLVRYSYKNPVDTFETNIMGTINVFEACRKSKSVNAIINITSDKCYENREWVWGYREKDRMGGFDPYSCSKGCAELITSSYRNSFFNLSGYGATHNILLASARAGNIIGGGDWGDDRLLPDIMRAVKRNAEVIIRNPTASRPWQHVLEPLSGYLILGQRLLEGRTEYADGWNFGPNIECTTNVENLVKSCKKIWNRIQYKTVTDKSNPHEAGQLKLDCSKAHSLLKWKPVWDLQRTLEMTLNWYRDYYEKNKINSIANLRAYYDDAKSQELHWTLQ
ncbi:MAG: CDP-glucose 4,6-dehydratase [Candidatus Omnitrophica bacterium]|nr:CDP-glucose 4,6-dehydratase [Candidatus Omnitrophota bacterium]